MPKPLNLKKVRSLPSKSQKSITQFFQNPTASSTKNTSCNSEQSNSKKRKGTPLNIVEKSVSRDSFKNEHSVSIVHSNSIPKKIRNESFAINDDLLKEKKTFVKHSAQATEANEYSVLSTNKYEEKSCENENILNDKEVEYLSKNSKERSPFNLVDNVERILMSDVDIIESVVFGLSPTEYTNNPLKSKESPNGKENFSGIEITEPNSLNEISSLKVNKSASVRKKSPTPKKSPLELRSPRMAVQIFTPQKKLEKGFSNFTEKVKISLNFDCDDINEMLDDAWEKLNVDQEDLDLDKMQRCEIIGIERYHTRMKLKLKNSVNQKCTCYIEGIWTDVPLSTGDIVSIVATKSSENVYCINNSTGLLVFRPDFLISSTSVVSGVFCQRKAVLQERFKGLDLSNAAMTIGILVHELVQRAVAQKIHSMNKLHVEAQSLVKESIGMLYDAGLSMDEVYASMNTYIPSLSSFVTQYVLDKCSSHIKNDSKNMWDGHIDNVLDIEENVCCSKLGLKGKIDATLQVTIHNRAEKKQKIMPLELKSGKASGSVEHRGQLILYGMMLALQRNANPAHDPDQTGLLLYLRDKIDLREVKCGYPERRDLIMLRNQLVQYLAPGPKGTDCDNVTDIEEAAHLLRQQLPEPVHHQTACGKCPYLTLCSLHIWHTEGPKVSESHPLYRLRETALGHLLNTHISYFLQWTALCKLEEQSQATQAPLHALWTESPEKRAQRGICIPNLLVESVEVNGDRFMHVFKREEAFFSDNDKDNSKGPQEGEFAIVSTNDRAWIACGTILSVDSKKARMVLERDLSRRHSNTCLFHIDTYESYATTVQNLTNLGVLMDDDDNSERLRRLIIDMEVPEFEKKLPREIGRLGSKLMKGLNIEQQRAVLRAIAAKDYILLQGLPGTGKTQTISVLIQMLVALKQRVLVTAHTHSAVDNVLSRLPTTLKILRLGTTSRVAPAIQSFCEHRVTESCTTPEELAKLFERMEVVGVTCLGASHTLLTKTKFNVCIVDEATQVLQCTVLRPLFAAQRFVLVGDPAQLPPVVRSNDARRLGMEESLFARLVAVSAEARSALCLQYRMNGAITDLANAVAYDSRLRCANDDIRNATMTLSYKKITDTIDSLWLLTTCSPTLEQSVIFIDTGSTSHGIDTKSNSNKDEALIVLSILKALTIGEMAPTHVGVIAPYREQVVLLRKSVSCLFKNDTPPEVSTVDQFQGRDKSVIIFSCTKTSTDANRERKLKEGEILNDPRRLAVSVTRAKHKFITIGNVNVLKRYEPFQKLIAACSPITLPVGWQEDLYKEFEYLL